MTTSLIHDHFEQIAASCEKMGSPFTAALSRASISCLDQSTKTGQRILNWPSDPHPDALALRLFGGLQSLAISNAEDDLRLVYPPNQVADTVLVEVVRSAIKQHDDWLCAFISSPPQTNEIARSAALLPGFLAIVAQTGLPLALHEIGSSAGLNLFPDHYLYRYDNQYWGDRSFPSELAPVMRGAVPDLSEQLVVNARRGNDIAPINVNDDKGLGRLRAYIWADQSERKQRLDAAVAVAQKHHFSLTQGDAADFVDEWLNARKPGEVFVLFHSVVWQYLHQVTKDRISEAMHNAGRSTDERSPIAWLCMEGDAEDTSRAVVKLTLWPTGETRALGHADFHLRWLDWFPS